MPTANPPQRAPQDRAQVLTGKTYRMMRKAHGLRLVELAGMVGVTPSHLSRVESGERPASPALQDRIVSALADLSSQAAS
jgi:transcriptional regulator with XRE-family HTH domain